MDHQLLVESEKEAFAAEYERAQQFAGDRTKWEYARRVVPAHGSGA